MGNHWFIIQTNPNCEEKATRELRRNGFRVYIPKRSYTRQHKRTGKEQIISRPLLTGYVLMRFPPEMVSGGVPQFGVARQCQGVKNFVRAMTATGEWEPFPIPAEKVATLMRRQRGKEFGRPVVESKAQRRQRLRDKYKRGETMRVAEGPFTSFLATISQLRKDGVVEATITIFGRETKLLFDDPERDLRKVA